MYLTNKKEDEKRQVFSTNNWHIAKFSPNFRDHINDFITELYCYFSDKRYDFIHGLRSFIKSIPEMLSDNKQNLVSKIFWGRGLTYKYFSFVGIGLLIFASALTFGIKNNLTTNNSQNFSLASNISNSLSSSSQTVEIRSIDQKSKSIVTTEPVNNSTSSISGADWYVVQSGDTINSIATKFNMSPDVFEWSTGYSVTNDSDLKAGLKIHIIPVQGIMYTVVNGDTIANIASKYSVTSQSISDWNVLTSDQLTNGQKLFLQNAVIPHVAPVTSYKYAAVTRSSGSLGSGDGSAWYYSQADSRWANIVLGGGYSAYNYYNVKNIGCLVTSVAMVAKYYGYNMTPGMVAQNPSNFDGVLFNWNGLGYFNVVPLGGIFSGYVNWSEVNNALANNHPVIVSVEDAYHYVVLFKRDAEGHYIMNDPALDKGPNLRFDSYYSLAGVTQAVEYIPN